MPKFNLKVGLSLYGLGLVALTLLDVFFPFIVRRPGWIWLLSDRFIQADIAEQPGVGCLFI